MAVQDCDKISNIAAIGIAAGDDELAQEIAELSIIKNDALQRARNLAQTGEAVDAVTGLSAHKLELRASSAEIKIRAIVQASILKGDMGNEALLELARQIDKTKGNLAGGVELLQKVQDTRITDYAEFKEIARLRDETMDPDDAIKEIEDSISEFVSSGYSIREYSDFYNDMIETSKKAFKDEKIDMDEFKKQILEEYKNVTKKISKGENPSGFAKLDNEWQAIKKVYGDEPERAGKAWAQYIMAREMLADGGLDDGIIKAFELGGENLLGPLDLEWITKCNDLDQLMARAFTNTEQLYREGTLREAYRDRLTQLASGLRLNEENTKKVKSLIKISLFAEEGATLSEVMLDNRAFSSMKNMGYKVSESQGRKIYNDLRTLAKQLADGKTIEKMEIAGIEVVEKDVLQLIYDVTGDKNILKLMAGGNFSDTAILGVATQKLLGDNDKAKEALIKLFRKGKEGNKVTNTRGVFLRATTGMEVPDGAKVGFFDYRKSLGYFKDASTDAKANFMDKLVEKNKMRIDSTGVVEIKDSTDVNTLAEELKKNAGGGFLIVNDNGYRDNETLRQALNKLKGTDNEITVLSPKGGMSANFSIEDGVVYFKTTNDNIFDRVAGTVSIQSMGEAQPTREMIATAYEATTRKNGEWVGIEASMYRGTTDDFFQKGDGYVNLKKSSEDLRNEDGYATLYDIISNKWYDGKLSILGGKLKTDRKATQESYKAIKKIKIKGDGIPKVKVYRATNSLSDTIDYGEYVTLSKDFAQQMNIDRYGGAGEIIEQEVSIDKIWLRKDKTIEEGCYFYSRGEITQAVNNIGKPINADAAMVKYNKELNDAAVRYFGEMLGFSGKEVDEEYIKRVQTTLSDMLGIDIKAFDTFSDNSQLWQRIDKELSLQRITAGRFDRDVADIRQLREGILRLSNEDLASQINDSFGDLVRGTNIATNENIDLIREAWFDYNTAATTEDLLSAKGKIVSLAHGVQPQTLSMADLQSMFREKNFAEKYKEMFFPEQEVNKKDFEMFIRQINSDIFDGLSIQFAENLVKAGYSLPLVNVKQVVNDYLLGKLDLNSDFVQAFFFKNNIPFTKANLDTVMSTMMPTSFSFNFESYAGKLYDESLVGDVYRIVEVENRFLPDSYSALYAIEDAGNNITLGNKDYKVLEGMLESYKNQVLAGVKSGNFSFKDAQKLKQEFGYALDMFEQDYLIPRYGQFLSPQQRQAVQGMKYSLPIGVSGQPYSKVEKMLDETNSNIMSTYRSILGDMVSSNDINAAIAKGYNKSLTSDELAERIERRREQLQNAGATIKEVNGEYIVYNSRDALRETIETMPENIQGLAGLKALGRKGLDDLTNQQVYKILRYLEATKALSSTYNLPTQLMYKQNPQLAQYSFFSTYVVDPSTGLPRVMGNNSLNVDTFFDNIESSAAVDNTIKKDIFEGIINQFKKDGYVLETSIKSNGKITTKGLNDIISEAVSRQVDELNSLKLVPGDVDTAKAKMQNIYTNMFIPYTYLRDIPDGGKTLANTPLVNVKERVESTMKATYNKAIEDLKAAGATDDDRLQQMITVRLDDGQVMNLEDLSKQDTNSWKKSIFNDESVFVKGADDTDYAIDPTKTLKEQQKTANEDKIYRERVQNDYLSSLQTILNQGQIISDAEREMMTSFMSNVRTDLRKYSLTSKLVDTLDALSGMNEEVARGIKNYLIGFTGTVTFGKVGSAHIVERYRLVKQAYEGYYDMTLEQLMRVKPGNEAEQLARNAARYFKNMERMLGSADGLTGITTNPEVNKAFYHIGEVFMGLDDKSVKGVRGIFSMLSAIEQNQVLKFFKFSKPGQASYVKEFVQSSAKDLFWDGLGGYRDYVQNINPQLTREKFNLWFGTNYDDDVFKRVVQGLSGFSLSGGGIWRVFNQALDIMNGSNIVFRFLMSYPGQLLTIAQQGTAYFLKQLGFSTKLGIEDMAKIDAVRENFGILDGAYNELNIWGKTSFNLDSKDVNSYYNRYGIPDISKAYQGSTITTSDDYINMYAKLDSKYSKPDLLMKWVKWFDPYKDNANNFIDGIFARNFKNVAFVKGLRDNNFMKFTDAEAFLDFMNDAAISSEIKSKLLDAVAAASGRNFRNILGLGFGGLDRAVGANAAQNIFYGLMQMFNFRGAWGQNIFKQTFTSVSELFKRLGSQVGLSSVAKEEATKYIANSPEFVNFVTALFNDLERSFKLQRYQDNGRWPDEDGDEWHYALDFLSYMRETMNMTSQWYQGIQSFGPMRPVLEMTESINRSAMDPTVYTDTWGMGAFFNARGKNFLRQWKPINWLTEMAGAIESGGMPEWRAYMQNKFFNLSFGSLRYMVNEGTNAYGYTYEVTGQYGGIPGIVMGEAQIGSDKSFGYELDNNETWDTMKIIADPDIPWSDKRKYWGNLRKTATNGSQFWSTVKNFTKVVKGEYSKSFFTADDLAETIQTTEAGKEFYSKGYVTPKTVNESTKFFKTILNHSEYRPGSTQFSKSLMQYEDSGHMDLGKGNKADAQMELRLDHVKYKTNEHGEFILKDGERQIDGDWTNLIKNVKTYYNNEEYVRNTVYNYFKNWLDDHSSDPNYPLYTKMLGQGQAHLLIENEMDRRIAAHNVGKKGTDKWTEANFNQAEYRDMLLEMGNSVLPGDNMTFFDRLNRLDTDDATLAAMDIIMNQAKGEDRKILEKFYTTTTSTVDGEVVEDMELKPQYKSILEQIGRVGRAMDDGNVDRVIASMASLTNMFKNDDPTGIVTANLINSIYNRNYQAANLTPEQKQEIMIGVFYDNKDFIQRNPTKMRELLGDEYDEYARLMNEMIYQWDGQLISNLESIISSGKSEEGAKNASSKASKLSSAFKDLAMNYGSKGGGTTSTGKKAGLGYGKWVPVKIQGADLVKDLGLKGYTPNNIKEVFQGYKPHADFSIGKDINRKVEATKSQQISTKKQLSNIEKKVTKALEAES